MTRGTTLTTTTTPAPVATMSQAQSLICALNTEAVKADAVQRAADAVLAQGLLAWFAGESEATRREIFVTVEASLSAAGRRKLAPHALRPVIDEALIETARLEIDRQKKAERAERERVREEEKRARALTAEERKRAQEERFIAKAAEFMAKREAMAEARQVATPQQQIDEDPTL